MKTGVIHAKCQNTGKDYDMAMQERPAGGWYVMRAYPTSGKQTRFYEGEEVEYTGGLYIHSDYNGCPHCQSGVSFVKCGTCGKFSCYDKSGTGKCAWCGKTLNVTGTVKDFKSSKGQ